MNVGNVIGQDTTSEDRTDLDLDLIDVMLDLDPGMLAWGLPETR